MYRSSEHHITMIAKLATASVWSDAVLCEHEAAALPAAQDKGK